MFAAITASLTRRIAIALALCVIAQPLLAAQWQVYSPPNRGFSIEFPDTPRERAFDTQGPNGITTNLRAVVTNRDDSAGFMMNHAVWTGRPTNPEPGVEQELLEAARDRVAEMGNIRESTAIQVNAHPGWRLVLELPKDHQVLYTHLSVVGNRLYQATYIAPIGQENQDDLRHFLGSLKLLPR